MAPTATYGPGPSDRWIGNWGNLILWGGFGFLFLILLFLTWAAPDALPFIPVILIGGACAIYLFHHPLLNLAAVMVGFVAVVGFKAGLQVTEMLYGVYFLAFLGHWFLTRSILNGEVLCRRTEERVLLIFICMLLATIPLSFLRDGWPNWILNEALSLVMLLFYWPIREAIEKNENGLKVVLISLTMVGLFVLARNILEYQSDLSNAEELWQIAKSRAIANESLLMVPAIFSMALFLRTKSMWGRFCYLGIVLGLFAGLILTQSRAYWVAIFLGAGVVFLFVSMKDKIRMLSVGALSAAGVAALAYLVLGDFLVFVVTGLLDRFLTLESAVTKDISLINRFLEAQGAWQHIKVNPILGHGLGVPYRFFNITYLYSEIKPYVHNGYVGILYKAGLWGLGMVLFLVGRFFFMGIGNWRRYALRPIPAIISLAAAGCIAALALTATTATPFFVNDLMFMYAVLWGIIGGIRARQELHP